MTTRVTLICSSKDVRDRLQVEMAGVRGVELQAHIGSARTLLSVLQKERPDVVVLDLPQASDDDLPLIEAATAQAPGTPVVLVSPDQSVEFLRRAMRAGVRDILPSPMGEHIVQRAVDYVAESKSVSSRFPGASCVVMSFLSAKGGAGATFLATNLAEALAARGKRVLLMDLNLYFGDAVLFVTERKPTASIVDMALRADRLDAALLESSVLVTPGNVHMLSAPDLPERLDAVTPQVLDAIVLQARMAYDFVILDVGRSLTPLTVKALDLSERIYLTLQLSLPAIQAVKRLATVFKGLGYAGGKYSAVVNRLERSTPIKLEELERVAGVAVRHTVPCSAAAVAASVNEGIPLIRSAPRDAVARVLQDWAEELSPVVVKPGRNWLHMFSRSPA